MGFQSHGQGGVRPQVGLVRSRRLGSALRSGGTLSWNPPEVSAKQHFHVSSDGAQLTGGGSRITSVAVLICVTGPVEQARELNFSSLFPLPQGKLGRAENLLNLIFIK